MYQNKRKQELLEAWKHPQICLPNIKSFHHIKNSKISDSQWYDYFGSLLCVANARNIDIVDEKGLAMGISAVNLNAEITLSEVPSGITQFKTRKESCSELERGCVL